MQGRNFGLKVGVPIEKENEALLGREGGEWGGSMLAVTVRTGAWVDQCNVNNVSKLKGY